MGFRIRNWLFIKWRCKAIMSKILYSITIKGKTRTWGFDTWVDQKQEQYVDEWRKDGIEINKKLNSIPEWVVNARLTRIWCFLQDVGIVPIN